MTATATHDTKRGEDARARLMALTEIPSDWTSAVARWKLLNAPHLVTDGVLRSPSASFEYMIYQTLLGIWPAEGEDKTLPERLQAYALKAAREGKQETSWLNPNEAYEAGLRSFIARILDPALSGEFLQSLGNLARRTALLGALNSLSQVTLKATMPGVPDFYQGTEFWDLSMVDPDNRRPVDFAARAAALREVEAPDWDGLTRDWRDGRIKLAWTRHLLRLRNELASVFTSGAYEPLDVSGPHRDHIIAFARRHGRDAAIIVVGRAMAPFCEDGRTWPRADAFDAAVQLAGYAVETYDGATELAASSLFTHLPAAVVKARAEALAPQLRSRVTA
jgi:(1->4)-alpha-D-glucan 1-alpha-D-glucosylmutase